MDSIDNDIGDAGATTLGEALKINTSLVKLNLECDNTRKRTNNIILSFTEYSQTT